MKPLMPNFTAVLFVGFLLGFGSCAFLAALVC